MGLSTSNHWVCQSLESSLSHSLSFLFVLNILYPGIIHTEIEFIMKLLLSGLTHDPLSC